MGCQIAALKLLIILPNIVFFCSGGFMVGYTANLLINHMDAELFDAYEQQLKIDVKTGVYAIAGATIAAGVILCIVSLMAVCGALADKRKMLKAYAIILCVVILLQIIASVVAFVAGPNAIKAELPDEDHKKEFEATMSNLKHYTYYYGMGLIIMVCIEIILALSACFLSSKMKQDQVWEF